MTRPATISADIERALQKDAPQLGAAGAALAREYAALCTSANQRLRRGREWLKKGMVTEALARRSASRNAFSRISASCTAWTFFSVSTFAIFIAETVIASPWGRR